MNEGILLRHFSSSPKKWHYFAKPWLTLGWVLCCLWGPTLLGQAENTIIDANTGDFVWADDIMIPDDASKSAHVTRLWPEGIVPYVFHSAIQPWQRDMIFAAMDEWASAAYLRFVPRDGHDNYIYFQIDTNPAPGLCGRSFIGMVGGLQKIFISCWNHPLILHEIGHALGLIHEHQRSDRDTYVQVLWNNIIPGSEGNFGINNFALLSTPYDFESIMHYHRQAFSKNGSYTLITTPPYQDYLFVMGTAQNLSELDREGY